MSTNSEGSALIGCTGFVGGNLLRQRSFDAGFHSRNIDTIAGRRFDLLVCAGAPAEKWRANAAPDEDRAALARLMGVLAQVEAAEVILVSTVDVYPTPRAVDESTPIDPAMAQPYGRHRYELERFVAGRFPARIVRLPALFGPGLKKNAVYDLLHGNQVERIPADGVFQFYNLRHLWRDLEVVRGHDLRLVNLATEPVAMRDVAESAFGVTLASGASPASAPRYDMRSTHAERFGGRDGYLYDRRTVLAELRDFVREQRATT